MFSRSYHKSIIVCISRDLRYINLHCSFNIQKIDGYISLCNGWAGLWKFLRRSPPPNLIEWGNLPFWRPHINHINQNGAKCVNRVLRLHHASGITHLRHIWDPREPFIPWVDILHGGGHWYCELASPRSDSLEMREAIFLKELFTWTRQRLVWQFWVPDNHLTEEWGCHLWILAHNYAHSRYRSEPTTYTIMQPGPRGHSS